MGKKDKSRKNEARIDEGVTKEGEIDAGDRERSWGKGEAIREGRG